MGGAQGACPQIGAGSKRAATAWSGARRRPTAACRQCRVAGLPACTGIASLACTGSASPPPPPPRHLFLSRRRGGAACLRVSDVGEGGAERRARPAQYAV